MKKRYMDDLDPVLVSTLYLLDMVARHGHPNDADAACHYQGMMCKNVQHAIGTEDDVITPMITWGYGRLAELILLGYHLHHKFGRVTPSLEADFFVPVWESREYLANKLY